MASQEENHNGPCSDAVDRALNKPDVLVRNEGTIFLFQPLAPAAKQWIDENVQPNAQWFANALVIEHRFAADLAAAMRGGWASSRGKEITIRMRYWGDIELPDEDELAETVNSAYIPAADATPQYDAEHVEE